MADNPKPKRRLKPPQTVRERALEQSSKAEQPVKTKRTGKLKRLLAWPFKTLARPFISIGKFLGKFRVFRFIAKIFKFIGKILLIPYIISSWQELRLVTWPSRKESLRLTFAVLAFAIVFGALIASLDFGLSHLFKSILLSNHH